MSLLEQVVPEGYKQTDIGIVPSEWSEKSFGDICVVNQGLQIPIEQRAKRQTDGSKVYITIQSLNNSDEPEFIETYSPSVCCNESDILMTRTGNTGIVVHGVTGVFHNNFFKLKFDRNKINDLFLVYYLRSNRCQKTILDKAGTSTIPDLNHGDFYSIKLALPEYKEQTAIANALSDIDALLTELEKLIDKKQAIKTATMQQLLTGKTRLPQFATYTKGTVEGKRKGTKPSKLGEIPEDWDAIRMGDLAKVQRGASPRPIDSPIWFDRNSEIGWLRISDVTKTSKYLFETTQSLSRLGVENSRYVASGNLVMSICATVGKPIITRKHLCIHDGFVVFNNLQVEPSYMYYILKDLEDEWGKQGQTGSQMNLNTDLINSTFISVPQNKEEQTAIANILSDMDNEIQTLEQRLAKTRQIKHGMMQELLTGCTRLPY